MTDWKEQAVELAARAACREVEGDPDELEVATGDGVDPRSTHEPRWTFFADEIRAALEATGFFELVEVATEASLDLKIAGGNADNAAKTDPKWAGVGEILRSRAYSLDAALSKAKGEQ